MFFSNDKVLDVDLKILISRFDGFSLYEKKIFSYLFFEIWVCWPLIWVVRWVFEWWFVIFWRHVMMNVQNSITTQSRRSCWKNTDPPLSRESNRSWVCFALNFFFVRERDRWRGRVYIYIYRSSHFVFVRERGRWRGRVYVYIYREVHMWCSSTFFFCKTKSFFARDR